MIIYEYNYSITTSTTTTILDGDCNSNSDCGAGECCGRTSEDPYFTCRTIDEQVGCLCETTSDCEYSTTLDCCCECQGEPTICQNSFGCDFPGSGCACLP